MYVVLADATYLLVALAALAVGFGMCVAVLIIQEVLSKIQEALSRRLKTLLPIRQGARKSQAQRRPQSFTREPAMARPVLVNRRHML
jgi:hypothetical protein